MISYNQLNSRLLELGSYNNNLPLVHTTSVSFNGLIPKGDFMGISVSSQEEMFLEQSGNEIKDTIHRDILKSMSSFNEDYLNVMKNPKDESIWKLCHYLKSGGYDYLIIPPWMASIMEASLAFGFAKQEEIESGVFYYIGDLWHVRCYVNSFASWNSKDIICGKKNHFSYNLVVDIDDQLSSTGRTILNVNHNITYDSTGFMLLHFVDEYNPKYVQFNRDNKINDILS